MQDRDRDVDSKQQEIQTEETVERCKKGKTEKVREETTHALWWLKDAKCLASNQTSLLSVYYSPNS